MTNKITKTSTIIEAPTAIKTATSRGVSRMLGFDLHWWETAMLVSLAVAAIAAAAVGVATTAVVRLTREESREKSEAIAVAQKDAALANRESAYAKLETEKLKAAQAPWDFSQEKRAVFSAQLAAVPKEKIMLMYSSADGTRGSDFADALNRVLKIDLKFDVWGYVGPFTSAGPAPLVGIGISTNDPGAWPLRDSLAKAFNAIGIDVQVTDVKSGMASEAKQTVIAIGIKPKPK